MRVVNACFVYNKSFASEEELLESHYTTTNWAENLQERGVEVIVLQRFLRTRFLQRNNVQYHFLNDRFGERLRAWQVPFHFLFEARRLNADVIHVHSTMLTGLLRMIVRRNTVIVIQNHGGPRPSGLRGFVYRWVDSFADALFFTTIEQGKDWYNRSLDEKILPVIEGSNSFMYQDRHIAREATSLTGSPILTWVGHLNENKDPLVVLEGFEELLRVYPNARLYMIYGKEQLLPRIKEKIKTSKLLQNTVILLGQVPHKKMEAYLNSADYFVLGSHAEGSGYSLSEALACGCIPIVTDIPSFRMMTDNGRLGALWSVGDSSSFVEAARRAINKPIIDESKACVDFFNRNLSFDAIADITLKHYKTVVKSRSNIL